MAGSFQARYVGSVRVTVPGGKEIIVEAMTKARKESSQVVRACLAVDKQYIRITDRSMKDVMMTAEKDTVSCHGLEPGNGNFLGIIVLQSGAFWCHCLNLKKDQAEGANRALIAALGGGDCAVLPKFNATKAAKVDRKLSRKASVKPSNVRAASHSMLTHPMPAFSSNEQEMHQGPESGPTPAGRRPSTAQDQLTSTTSHRFAGLYLGDATVTELFGTDTVKRAVAKNTRERAKVNAQDPSAGLGDAVMVEVSMEAVRTSDRHSGSVMFTEFIKNISYTCVLDAVDHTDVFAFIAVNKRLGAIVCHIYHVPKGSGNKAYAAINTAFQLLAADEKSRGSNPFEVSDPRRDPAPELLFRHQIHRTDLKAIQQIGAGQFGAVYIATQRVKPGQGDNGGESVMRAVKLLRNAASDDDKKSFTQEAETMLVLDHPKLVKMIGVAVQQRPWLCVLEYMKYGDLKSFLSTCREKQLALRYGEMLHFGQQLASGMSYLASQRMVHMDLAARNALVGDNNTVKVADFGLTRPMEEGKNYLILREPMKLALKWISIEGMDKKLFSEKSDVWSYGVLLWEIASYGSTPYGRVKTSDIQAAVREGTRLQRPSTCPEDFYEVMQGCWMAEPGDRPAFLMLEMQLHKLRESNPCPARDVGAQLSGVKSGKGSPTPGPATSAKPNSAAAPKADPANGTSEVPAGQRRTSGMLMTSKTSSALLQHAASHGDPNSSTARRKSKKEKPSVAPETFMERMASAWSNADAGATSPVEDKPSPSSSAATSLEPSAGAFVSSGGADADNVEENGDEIDEAALFGPSDSAALDDFGFGGDEFGFGDAGRAGSADPPRPKAYDNVTLLGEQPSVNGHPGENGDAAESPLASAGPSRYNNVVLLGDRPEIVAEETPQPSAQRYENVTLLADSAAEEGAPVAVTSSGLYDT